jgi:hypothetical protein
VDERIGAGELWTRIRRVLGYGVSRGRLQGPIEPGHVAFFQPVSGQSKVLHYPEIVQAYQLSASGDTVGRWYLDLAQVLHDAFSRRDRWP